jgi:hypothetical protein
MPSDANTRGSREQNETRVVKNLTSKSITLGDMKFPFEIRPGQSVDLLKYVSLNNIGKSQDLKQAIKLGFLQYKDRDSAIVSNNDDSVQKALLPAVLRDITPNNNDVVTSLSSEGLEQLTGDVTLSEGVNIILTQIGNDIEIRAVGAASDDFVGLIDTPNSFAGFAGFALFVNNDEDAVEFVNNPTFDNLTVNNDLIVNGNITANDLVVTDILLSGTISSGSGGVDIADDLNVTGNLNVGGCISGPSGGVNICDDLNVDGNLSIGGVNFGSAGDINIQRRIRFGIRQHVDSCFYGSYNDSKRTVMQLS